MKRNVLLRPELGFSPAQPGPWPRGAQGLTGGGRLQCGDLGGSSAAGAGESWGAGEGWRGRSEFSEFSGSARRTGLTRWAGRDGRRGGQRRPISRPIALQGRHGRSSSGTQLPLTLRGGGASVLLGQDPILSGLNEIPKAAAPSLTLVRKREGRVSHPAEGPDTGQGWPCVRRRTSASQWVPRRVRSLFHFVDRHML